MKFLRHTRIGTRLTLAMLLMALATAGIGSIGWLYVARMGDIIRANYQDNVQHVLCSARPMTPSSAPTWSGGSCC